MLCAGSFLAFLQTAFKTPSLSTVPDTLPICHKEDWAERIGVPDMPAQSRLPPELLYHIIDYLNDPLDMIAASLVCIQWYHTLRHLFSITGQNFTWYLRNPQARQRFAALLSAAHQLGLPPYDAFKTHDIRLESIRDELLALKSPDNNALFTILDLTVATHVRITIYSASFALPNWQPLISRLQLMCSTMTTLELSLPLKSEAPLLYDNYLASIVHAARSSLQFVDLKNKPGSATIKALMCCQNVRAVRFSNVNLNLLLKLTNQWCGLREAELNLQCVLSISAVVRALCASATTLEKLSLSGPEVVDEGSAVGLMDLLDRCTCLRKLCLIDLICVNDTLLRDLASNCQELDEVCVYVGSAVEDAEPRMIQWHRGPDGDAFAF